VRDSRWYSLPIHIALLIGLLFCAYLAVRRGVAAWYFREASPDAIQAAMKWDPGNSQYYDALGTLSHLYADTASSEDIVRLYQTATRLSPHDAQLWADLGAGYDWAGDPDNAIAAFRRAVQLFPNSPEINWRLANFYIRAGKIPEGLGALRIVLEGDSAAQSKVFALATNATGDKNAILEMLPPRAPIYFGYLDFLIQRQDIVGAEQVWAQILTLKLAFELRDAFPYLDGLIQHKEPSRLTEAWSELAERFPSRIERPELPSNLVKNGGFESDILNGGLDWRVVPVEGAVVSLDSVDALEGTRALQIKFEGTHNPDYAHVLQYVPVQPNTRYRFSGYMRTKGITTDSGPRFQICDAYNMGSLFVSTENVVGTSEWLEQHAEFLTKADTHLILLRVARPLSSKLDNRIAGSVWIDRVSLSVAQ
jgi:hypothetical protein